MDRDRARCVARRGYPTNRALAPAGAACGLSPRQSGSTTCLTSICAFYHSQYSSAVWPRLAPSVACRDVFLRAIVDGQPSMPAIDGVGRGLHAFLVGEGADLDLTGAVTSEDGDEEIEGGDSCHGQHRTIGD